MAGNQGRGKGFFRNLLSGNSSRPTLLRGDPHEREVTGSARRARQEEAARYSIAQWSSALDLVRTPLEDQASSIQSSWGFQVMMIMLLMMLNTKLLIFAEWTGLLSRGATGDLHRGLLDWTGQFCAIEPWSSRPVLCD